jgi:hypothetical protein
MSTPAPQPARDRDGSALANLVDCLTRQAHHPDPTTGNCVNLQSTTHLHLSDWVLEPELLPVVLAPPLPNPLSPVIPRSPRQQVGELNYSSSSQSASAES